MPLVPRALPAPVGSLSEQATQEKPVQTNDFEHIELRHIGSFSSLQGERISNLQRFAHSFLWAHMLLGGISISISIGR